MGGALKQRNKTNSSNFESPKWLEKIKKLMRETKKDEGRFKTKI